MTCMRTFIVVSDSEDFEHEMRKKVPPSYAETHFLQGESFCGITPLITL